MVRRTGYASGSEAVGDVEQFEGLGLEVGGLGVLFEGDVGGTHADGVLGEGAEVAEERAEAMDVRSVRGPFRGILSSAALERTAGATIEDLRASAPTGSWSVKRSGASEHSMWSRT